MDFADVEEAVAVGHELNEGAEVHDRAYGAVVYLAFFGKLHNGVDVLVGAATSMYPPSSTLDDFSARADHSADQAPWE